MWVEPQAQDAPTDMMIAPRITSGYIEWWIGFHLGPLGLDELDSNDGEVSQDSNEKDHMDMDNPIHDGPPSIGGFDVLVVITLAPSKEDSTCSIF